MHYIDCHRYLIEHNHLHKKDDVLAEQLLRGLVQLDPSCPEVLQLTELLLAKGVQINAYLPYNLQIILDLPN